MVDLNWRPIILQSIEAIKTNPFIPQNIFLFFGYKVKVIGLFDNSNLKFVNDNKPKL